MRMKHLSKLCIGLFFGFSTLAGAQPAPATTSSPFLGEKPCFHSSYDAWIGALQSKNSMQADKAAQLTTLFPRSKYESAQQQLDCHSIMYANDGLTILGWMTSPKHTDGKKLPVIILNRGGNGSFGTIKFANLFSYSFPLAERGFMVLSSQYRGFVPQQPEKFGSDEFGGSDVRDVEKLIAMVKDIPGADPDNIFMLGFSRGVMMSYMTARNNDNIRAMAMINGVADLEAELAFRPEMENVYRERIPGYQDNKVQLLKDRSVITWAEDLPRNTPILLLHGGKDERVGPANGPMLKKRLDSLKHPNKLVIYEDDDHFLDEEKVMAEVVGWFKSNLRPAQTAGASK